MHTGPTRIEREQEGSGPEFIYAESCDFESFPVGGTLSFSKKMLKTFGNRMALVGLVTDDSPCGRWTVKTIDGVAYRFFGVLRIRAKARRPLIPARLTTHLAFRRHLPRIRALGIRNVFTRTPQFALLLRRSHWHSRCFCFAGTASSVGISRYKHLRFLSALYERRLFKALSDFEAVLASADDEAIGGLVARSEGLLAEGQVRRFPTRYDDEVFFVRDRDDSRRARGLPADEKVFLVVGRLSWFKGWKFIIDAFRRFRERSSVDSILVFVGDGEDRGAIEDYVRDRPYVRLVGKKTANAVSDYLNAADVYVVGSHHEGWSNSMIEALGTGKAIVSTAISGADDMVVNGRNGYVVRDRDEDEFARRLHDALSLEDAAATSLELSKAYALSTLEQDLRRSWDFQSAGVRPSGPGAAYGGREP